MDYSQSCLCNSSFIWKTFKKTDFCSQIRKKRKEHDEVFDDKKEGSPKVGERSPSPLPAPARDIVHLPPPRDAFFEEPVPVVPIPPPVYVVLY
jgi:hypothetical protein